jgi:hypothetical protein
VGNDSDRIYIYLYPVGIERLSPIYPWAGTSLASWYHCPPVDITTYVVYTAVIAICPWLSRLLLSLSADPLLTIFPALLPCALHYIFAGLQGDVGWKWWLLCEPSYLVYQYAYTCSRIFIYMYIYIGNSYTGHTLSIYTGNGSATRQSTRPDHSNHLDHTLKYLNAHKACWNIVSLETTTG